jgi:hypothetical protein
MMTGFIQCLEQPVVVAVVLVVYYYNLYIVDLVRGNP